MALWLVRAGKNGEHENKFFEDNRIYLTWDGLSRDLSALNERKELRTLLEEIYPDDSKKRISSHLGQIWKFSKEMDKGDWVVLPSKYKSAIHVAKVTGDYSFVHDGENPYYHYREVEWIAQDIPRTNFDQDLLYSFGAVGTICQVSRNKAEQRIREMKENNWKPSKTILLSREEETDNGSTREEDKPLDLDLAQAARDQVAEWISRHFKGNDMETLVDAVLRAQGYKTYRTPEGPDKGIDILAAPEPMGFGEPSICVQVKSSDTAVDRPTLQQLQGAMQDVNSTHGLLVSWGGFKSSVDKEKAAQFFRSTPLGSGRSNQPSVCPLRQAR